MRSLTKTFLLAATYVACAALQVAAQSAFDSRQPGYPKTSAFNDFEWTDSSTAVVKIEEKSYQLKSIDGISVEQMIQKCTDEGWEAKTRIAVDHMQILKLMGSEIGDTVDLVVSNSEGKEFTLTDVFVTRKKRMSLTMALIARSNPFFSGAPGYPRWSPFSSVRWKDGKPLIEYKDKMYSLVSIHGATFEDIVAKCEKEKWPLERRFSEDLVQLLRLMGKDIDRETYFELRDAEGKTHKFEFVAKERQHGNPFASGAPGYPNWSPFTAVFWKDGKPQVEFKNQKYFPVSIHGTTFEEIKAKCQKEGWPLKKRFAEDLVQILRLMGKEVDRETFLELRDEKGKVHKFENVKMSGARRIASADTLEPQQKNADLDELRGKLEAQFSYLKANGFDYLSAIEKIRADKNIVNSIQLADAIERQVINRFIDGHAGVSGGSGRTQGSLPFLIESSGNRFVALKTDRSELIDPKHPYVSSIDGRTMSDWIASAKTYNPSGSDQYCQRHALRSMRSIEQLRSDMGLPTGNKLRVTLVGEQLNDTKEIEMEISEDSPVYGLWPRTKESTILDENIGYLRIVQMNDNAVDTIRAWMPKFKDTDGLVVDVRGNGGGIRLPIIALASFLMNHDDEPRIGNVCRYRLCEKFSKDHLSEARYVYRESSSRFGDREKKAIEKFKATFEPEWHPAEGEFSEWHYLVLSKKPDDKRHFYDKPVVILCDEKCFSATDIFLSSFKGWPNVTLIGHPSGGGSARVQGFQLTNSGIRIRCASMASFQPNGQLYDTRGVEPDIVVTRPPSYFLNDGEDVFLSRAIEEISAKKKRE